jgi:hypothetical protein
MSCLCLQVPFEYRYYIAKNAILILLQPNQLVNTPNRPFHFAHRQLRYGYPALHLRCHSLSHVAICIAVAPHIIHNYIAPSPTSVIGSGLGNEGKGVNDHMEPVRSSQPSTSSPSVAGSGSPPAPVVAKGGIREALERAKREAAAAAATGVTVPGATGHHGHAHSTHQRYASLGHSGGSHSMIDGHVDEGHHQYPNTPNANTNPNIT